MTGLDKKLVSSYAWAFRRLQAEHQAHQRQRAVANKQRRLFLDMVGKAGLTGALLRVSPVLAGVLANRHALAANGTFKRLVYCYLPGGALNGHWMPESAQQMNVCTAPYGPSGYDVAHVCHFREVDVLQTAFSSALQALGELFRGRPMRTMDERLASTLNAYAPHPHMYVGVAATTAGNLCSTLRPCHDGVKTAYKHYFGADAEAPTAAESARLEGMLATHHAALQQVKSKLGADEIARIEEHAQALEQVALQLRDERQAPGCAVTDPELTDTPTAASVNMQLHGRAMVDLIITALQCGLTNIATLQLSNYQGDWRMHEGEYQGDFLGAINNSTSAYDEMVAYLSDVPAYLIRQLLDKKGPDGEALLKSTVMAQVTCMGNGQDLSRTNAPFILASQMPGFAHGFSAKAGGTTLDFNGTIPKGMGISAGMYEPMGSDDLALLA